MENKTCIIQEYIKDLEYCMLVDSQEVSFMGKINAEYFEKEYKAKGYEVRKEKKYV